MKIKKINKKTKDSPWLPAPSILDATHAPGHGGYSRGRLRPYNQLEKYENEEDEINRIIVSKNEKAKQRRLTFYPRWLIVVD